jgi:hypothetical protein
LRLFEKLVLIPGSCVHIISNSLQIPQIEHLYSFLVATLNELVQGNQEIISARIDSSTISLFISRLREKHSGCIDSTKEQQIDKVHQLANHMSEIFFMKADQGEFGPSSGDYSSNIIIAGRMVAGCIRNLLIIYLIHINSSRGTTNKTSYTIHTNVDPLIEEREVIARHIQYTIALVDIIQREQHILNLHEEQIEQVANEFQNFDIIEAYLSKDGPLMNKKQQLESSVKHWQRNLHPHLSLQFLKTYKWFNARVKRYMEMNGQSIEILIKDTFDTIMKVYGVIQASDRNEREIIKLEQDEQKATNKWLEQGVEYDLEKIFREICMHEETFTMTQSPIALLFQEESFFIDLKDQYSKKRIEVVEKQKQAIRETFIVDDEFYKPFEIDKL